MLAEREDIDASISPSDGPGASVLGGPGGCSRPLEDFRLRFCRDCGFSGTWRRSSSISALNDAMTPSFCNTSASAIARLSLRSSFSAINSYDDVGMSKIGTLSFVLVTLMCELIMSTVLFILATCLRNRRK